MRGSEDEGEGEDEDEDEVFLPRHSERVEWLEWRKGWLSMSGAFPLPECLGSSPQPLPLST